MIIDKIENAELYYILDDKIAKAFDYLENTDFENIECGKYIIEEDNIYAIVQDYQTKPIDPCKWEAHKKYIDIQYIVQGQELIGYTNIENVESITEYDTDKDITFYTGEGDFITAKSGYFVILWPQDAHMPGIFVNETEYVKKVVVKIKI